jgi:hypothetical protein
MKRQRLPTAYCLLLTVVMLLGLPAQTSQPPTPTPTDSLASADALAWAVLPWACGLEILAVLLGLYLVLGRPSPAIIENASAPETHQEPEE